MEVDPDFLSLDDPILSLTRGLLLVAQVVIATCNCIVTFRPDLMVVLVVGFVGQYLLLLAITSGEDSWVRALRSYRHVPMLLHRSLNNTETLDIRNVMLNDRETSIDESAGRHDPPWTR